MTMTEKECKSVTHDEYTEGERFACTEPMRSSITFLLDQEEPVLKIDKDGFHYKGETIEDAGEAYKAFMEVMEMVKK